MLGPQRVIFSSFEILWIEPFIKGKGRGNPSLMFLPIRLLSTASCSNPNRFATQKSIWNSHIYSSSPTTLPKTAKNITEGLVKVAVWERRLVFRPLDGWSPPFIKGEKTQRERKTDGMHSSKILTQKGQGIWSVLSALCGFLFHEACLVVHQTICSFILMGTGSPRSQGEIRFLRSF